MDKNKKLKIHAIAYIILIILIGLIVMTALLTHVSAEEKLVKKHNNELIMSAQPSQTGKQSQLSSDINQKYNEMSINKNDINLTSIKKVSKKIDDKDLVITILGGYYTPAYVRQVGVFIDQLKKHDLYKKHDIKKVDLLLQSKVNENIDDYYKLYESKDADPYNYLGKYENYMPLITIFYKGKALDVRFRAEGEAYTDTSYAALKFLNEAEKLINEK